MSFNLVIYQFLSNLGIYLNWSKSDIYPCSSLLYEQSFTIDSRSLTLMKHILHSAVKKSGKT